MGGIKKLCSRLQAEDDNLILLSQLSVQSWFDFFAGYYNWKTWHIDRELSKEKITKKDSLFHKVHHCEICELLMYVVLSLNVESFSMIWAMWHAEDIIECNSGGL